MARGDRLQVEHHILGSTVMYMHHAIDLGDGTVVHAKPHDFRSPFAGGKVERTTFAEFARGREVRLVVDPPARFERDEIASRALSRVGREGYCPIVDNCEHFTTWCATGDRSSRQVEILTARVAAVAARGAAAASARAAAGSVSRMAMRSAVGGTVRLGMRAMVPTAIVAEAAAFAVEWRAHQAGQPAEQCRRSGERAGLATSVAVLAAAGAAAGPHGIVVGGFAGAVAWVSGSAAASIAARISRRIGPLTSRSR